MFRKKFLFVIMAITLLMSFIFSACGKSDTSDVFRVGIDDTYPPMEYKDEKGNNAGFDIDLALELGKRMGKEVEFVTTAWSAIFTALSSNKYDCIISSLSITEERKKTIAYTQPYIANSQCIIVKSDNTDINSEADLGGKIVAVQMGTTSDEACEEFQKTMTFKDYKKYEAMTEALNELKIGRIDCVVCDLVVGKYFVARDKESFKTVTTTLPNEPIGIGFTLKNKAMAEKVDKIISEMKADGTLKAISEKWFGEDMTANIQF